MEVLLSSGDECFRCSAVPFASASPGPAHTTDLVHINLVCFIFSWFLCCCKNCILRIITLLPCFTGVFLLFKKGWGVLFWKVTEFIEQPVLTNHHRVDLLLASQHRFFFLIWPSNHLFNIALSSIPVFSCPPPTSGCSTTHSTVCPSHLSVLTTVWRWKR